MNDALLLWGFGLFALAALLLVLEFFVPSGGLLGGLSALASVAGVVAFFRVSVGWGITASAALLVLAPSAIGLMIKVWPYTPVGRKMILGSPGTERARHAEAEALERRHERVELEALIGREGTALTVLRPVGEIEIDGVRHEGLAQGPAIERGDGVRVVGVEGNTLRVRRA